MHLPRQHSQNHLKLDDSPIAVLYRQHQATILTYIRRHVNTSEDAEDVLLEVFIAALEHDALADMDAGQQLAWFRRVAHNKFVDQYRRSPHRPLVPWEEVTETAIDNEALAPDQVALRNEEHALLRRHVARLPQLQQEVLHLRFAHGLRSTEIAQRLNKSEGAIRMVLSRSLNLLRSIYEQPSGGNTNHEH